ncbi:MAG: PspC domain-containing protein [Calditrichaeota bacterium]|nr:MAG: PspC domain-containing protein [Calditrichota bacterium]
MFPWGFNIFDSGVLISLLIIGAGLYFIFHKSGETHLEKPRETTAAPAGERARKLTRSVTDRKIAGVCGGLAKYFNIDSSIVRIVFVVLTVAAFYLTIIAYIVMAIVVPEEENEQAYTPPGQSAS